MPDVIPHGGSNGSQVSTEGGTIPDAASRVASANSIGKAGWRKVKTVVRSKSKQVPVADGRTYTSTSVDRRRRNELKNREQIQEIVNDNANSGSSEQPESIEPVAPAAGTVENQNRSGLLM